MKLAAFFPSNQALNRTAFYDHKGVKRLTLKVKHSVSGQVGSVTREVEAEVEYNFDFANKKAFGASLDIAGFGYVGMQSSDLVSHAIEALRPRTSYAFAKVINMKFDMRALCYVLGAAVSAGIGGCDFDVPVQRSGYRTLGMGWSVPDAGDLVIGPNIVTSSNELVTLLGLAGEAGVTSTTLLTDQVPGGNGLFLVGRPLAAYCRRVVANIFSAAHEAQCVGAHIMAFECGKTAFMTLNGHTDEGGWLRDLLVKKSYPASVGFVFGTGTEFGGIPLQERVDSSEIMRLSIAEYMEFVCLFPVADIQLNGELSILKKDGGSLSRPSSFELLAHQIFKVTAKVSILLCDLYGYHHDANLDVGANRKFLDDDSVDRHFDHDIIIPWLFVEYAPCLTRTYEGVQTPASMLGIVKLPMFNAKAVGHTSPYLDSAGRCVGGSEIWITRKAGNLRMEGASYLLSGRYSTANGLGALQFMGRGLDGSKGEEPAFLDINAPSVAAARWVTPHNPLPCEVEGLTRGDSIMKYTVLSGIRELTSMEAAHGIVESRFSTFIVGTSSKSMKKYSHRTVPDYILRGMRYVKDKLSHYTEVLSDSSITVSELIVTPPVIPDTSKEEGSTVALTATKTQTDDSPDPVGTPITALPSQTGIRPVAPTKTPGVTKTDKSVNGD